MARSRSDIANSGIRIFLQDVGKYYDRARGFDPFVPKKQQKIELLASFTNTCCYCDELLDTSTLSQDHLIPMNKTHLGLHAWGNVVPCCVSCNNKKQQRLWSEYLEETVNPKHYLARKSRIESYVSEMNYDPQLNLHTIADNLYEDVGEIAMTLINLRLKQAETAIQELLKM